ncbi:MAG: hypothetical protein U5R30_10365 [Deltaproteobacteria bacterium]|nr:hypothetical protein [Deltaproteobacteria bacterium]
MPGPRMRWSCAATITDPVLASRCRKSVHNFGGALGWSASGRFHRKEEGRLHYQSPGHRFTPASAPEERGGRLSREVKNLVAGNPNQGLICRL